MLFEALRGRYAQIAAKAQAGEFIEADLDALTGQVLAEAHELAPGDWLGEVRQLRRQVQDYGAALAGVAPDALAAASSVEGRRLRTFVDGAVVRLDEVVERFEGGER